MYTLGIIEESLVEKNALDKLKPYLFSQRLEEVLTDEYPLWHVNEYHVPRKEIEEFLPILTESVKYNYYIHAFSDEDLIVILNKRYFRISREKDHSWDAMIEYGVSIGVERHYLESVPLFV